MRILRSDAQIAGFVTLFMATFLLSGSVTPVPTTKNEIDISNVSSQLASLRLEVDDLQTEFTNKLAEQRTSLESLARQKVEIETTLRHRQTEITELQSEIGQMRQRIPVDADEKEIRKNLQKLAEILNNYVRESQPFLVTQRLKELDELSIDLDNADIPLYRIVNRLWSFASDEIRLTQESALHRQTLTLSGESVLAEIVRIGMMGLYFKTPDERYGMAVRSQSGWLFEVFEQPDEIKQTQILFEAFAKRIRVGRFALPNRLALAGVQR